MTMPQGPQAPPAPAVPAAAGGRGGGWLRRLSRDPYAIAACLMFVSLVICCWTGYVEGDEEFYLLGSRRLADPGLLAMDLTVGRLSPTTSLFDHLVAPLWSFLDAFAIVNLGRLLFWVAMAWAIMRLAKAIEIPAWSLVVGFTIWLLWKQSLGTCGSPFQGFQPKSFAYPLVVLALTSAIRGNAGRAGLAAGLGTAFHLVVGGWACLALFLSMLLNRTLFSIRQLGVFLLAAAPSVLPLLIAVFRFRNQHVPASGQSKMNEIYALFAMPHCCDPDFFMASHHIPFYMLRAAVVFGLALLVVFAWPRRRPAMIVGCYLAGVIAFFALGLIARRAGNFDLLTLFPFQLGNALPALFLFLFVAGWAGIRGLTSRTRWALAVPVLAGTLWLMVDGEVPQEVFYRAQGFLDEVKVLSVAEPTMTELDPLYEWVRVYTPRNSVFITPLIYEFWPYAERAQVASMRQPPLDQSIVEWKERLEALNGFRPFEQRGFEIETELAAHESALTAAQLARIRERYGATHYMVRKQRPDLAAHLLHAEQGYFIYDITRLAEDLGGRSP